VFLVDTNVISAASRAAANPRLVEWIERHSGTLYLSTITIAEIEEGIAKIRREGGKRKADELAAWLETLLHLYGARILPFDVEASRIAGRYADIARSKGRPAGFPDIAIAAIATAHQLTLLTRNTKDFEVFGIAVHDPYASLPTH
jgi:toxin FitB